MNFKLGYIYINDPDRYRRKIIYKSVQELRLCYGEIQDKEIKKVEIIDVK